MFEQLVGLIDGIKKDSIGEWIVDKENDGTLEHPIQMPYVVYSRLVRQFEDAVYDFEKEHPEYGLNRYGSIVERCGVDWGTESMSEVDVSCMDAQCIMALMMGAVRAICVQNEKFKKPCKTGQITALKEGFYSD